MLKFLFFDSDIRQGPKTASGPLVLEDSEWIDGSQLCPPDSLSCFCSCMRTAQTGLNSSCYDDYLTALPRSCASPGGCSPSRRVLPYQVRWHSNKPDRWLFQCY